MVAPTQKHPAVLIVNPGAGRSTRSHRDRLIGRVREHLDVEVIETQSPGEGIQASRETVAAGTGLIIALGGDGLVNEIANGIAHTDCALGILPGGTMNVLARDLGIPHRPEDAIQFLIERLDSAPIRIPLGRMDDRLFTFSAGCGFDAEVAELVESHRRQKRLLGESSFYLNALRVLAGSYRYRNARMTVSGSFGSVDVSMAVVCNAGPYAYFFGRPVKLTPRVQLQGGLDLFALRRMRLEAFPFYAFRAGIMGDVSRHKDAFSQHGLEELVVTSAHPFTRHVDGEPLAGSTEARFSIEESALRVIA